MRVALPVPNDAIVCCSFGDASANHATALTAINAARYAYRGGNPTPILFVCEDNGIGISVETPTRLDPRALRRHGAAWPTSRPPATLDEVWSQCQRAVRACRSARAPVFLHLDCVRLWGHAGSDVETGYRTLEEIGAVESRDPLLANARRLIETGAATPGALAALRARVIERVRAAGAEACRRPRLATRAAVVAPLAPYDEAAVRRAAALPADPERRRELFGGELPEEASARRAARSRRTSTARWPTSSPGAASCSLFGEDVGQEGRRLRRDGQAAEALRPRARLRHAARRDHDPGPRAGRRAHRPPAGAGDPVPGLRAQRARPAARRGLLARSSSPRASSRTRWSCASPASPTRRASAATSTTTTRSAALRDIPGLMLAVPGARRRRGAAAARSRGDRARLRARGRVPRADRALPRARPLPRRRRRLAHRLSRRRARPCCCPARSASTTRRPRTS